MVRSNPTFPVVTRGRYAINDAADELDRCGRRHYPLPTAETFRRLVRMGLGSGAEEAPLATAADHIDIVSTVGGGLLNIRCQWRQRRRASRPVRNNADMGY